MSVLELDFQQLLGFRLAEEQDEIVIGAKLGGKSGGDDDGSDEGS